MADDAKNFFFDPSVIASQLDANTGSKSEEDQEEDADLPFAYQDESQDSTPLAFGLAESGDVSTFVGLIESAPDLELFQSNPSNKEAGAMPTPVEPHRGIDDELEDCRSFLRSLGVGT